MDGRLHRRAVHGGAALGPAAEDPVVKVVAATSIEDHLAAPHVHRHDADVEIRDRRMIDRPIAVVIAGRQRTEEGRHRRSKPALHRKSHAVVVLDHEKEVDTIGPESAARSVDAPGAPLARDTAAAAVVGVPIDVDAFGTATRVTAALARRTDLATRAGVLVHATVAVFVHPPRIAPLTRRTARARISCVRVARRGGIRGGSGRGRLPRLIAAEARQQRQPDDPATHSSHVTDALQRVHG